MSKLTFKDSFELEYEDKEYAGEFSDLTRKQIKDFDKKYKDETDSDKVFKARLDISVSGDDKKAIMAIGETYNYKIIFDTIIKDIGDKKAKNS